MERQTLFSLFLWTTLVTKILITFLNARILADIFLDILFYVTSQNTFLEFCLNPPDQTDVTDL